MNAKTPFQLSAEKYLSVDFVTGNGERDTHAATLNDGRPNPHPSARTPYRTITEFHIAQLVQEPQCVPKERAAWTILSTFHDFDARSHDTQRIRGMFHGLAIDLDEGNHPLEEVRDTLTRAVGPNARMMIYSSRSSAIDNRKWRVLVPLATPVLGEDYHDTANSLFDLIEEASLGTMIPDRALARPAQLVYLPNRGDFYEHEIIAGAPLDLAIDHPIIVRREMLRSARAAAAAEARAERGRRQRERKDRTSGGNTSVIEAFNRNHSLDAELERHGYKRLGGSSDWRSPMQTSRKSYATRTYDGDFWISLSGSDAAAGIGRPSKNGGGCFGDAFDLYVFFDHGGNFTNAIRTYAQEAEMSFDDPHTVGGADFDWKNSKNQSADPDPESAESGEPEGEPSSPQDGPIPLYPHLPEAEPFPIDALGPALSRAAAAIARKVQLPEAIAGQSVLAAAALAAQAHADVVLPYGQSRPLSLFFITVAGSGDRKSSCDTEALWPIRKYERALKEAYATDHQAWTYAHAAWAAERKKIEADRKMSLDARKSALIFLGPEPERPLHPFLTAEDPTVEGLVKAWSTAPASLGLFSAEGGQFTGGYGMSTDSRLRTAASLSCLWDGAPIKRVRALDGVSVLYGRRLSLHLLVQNDVATEFLSDAMLRDQGLLSRVLVAAPGTVAGSRFYRDTAVGDDAAVRAYGARILSILETPWPMAEDSRNELAPRQLTISEPAKRQWRAFFDHIESQCGPEGELRRIRDFAAKSAEIAARIAGVLTIVENVRAEEIGLAAMESALVLMDWYVNEAVRLQQAARTDPKLVTAQRLLEWMQSRSTGSLVSFREIMQCGPSATRTKDAADAALKVLLSHGWITEETKRPRQFRVCPAEMAA